MIEDAEKKHDVELADALGREIHDVDVDILDLRAERLSRQLESRLGAPAWPVPREVVGGDDARGAAALGLEGEEPVPRADVEDRQASE